MVTAVTSDPAQSSQDRRVMKAPAETEVSAYLCFPPRLLYDACREAGRDDHGKACGTCPVRQFCDAGLFRAGRIRAADPGDNDE